MRNACLTIAIFAVSFSLSGQAPAIVQFNGQIGAFYDFYDYSHQNYANFRPRYPGNLGRLSAHATISIGKHFNMPFGLDITNQQSSYYLPELPEERLIDYIQSPRNNISFNPNYKWIQAYLGTQSPGFSSLTTGDIPIFGAGIEINPGRFLFSAHYGRSQLAINARPLENVAGAFEQRILASRIGVGSQDGTHFHLQLVHRKDDILSVETQPAGMQAQEGLVLAPLLQVRLSPSLVFKTETAASVYTRDLSGMDMPFENDLIPYLERVMEVNGSTNADWSNISSLEWQAEQAGLGVEVRYIGPGFEPVGFRAMERDLIDYNLKGNLSLLNNTVHLNGTSGIRSNNLQNTAAETTSRFIANLNVFAQVTESFSLASSYSNFGFRNNALFDTLKIEMIQNVFSVSPGLQLGGQAANHFVNATFSLQLYDDFNVFTGDFQSTRSTSINTSYQLVLKDSPFSAGLMAMYLNNEVTGMDLSLYNIGINARYQLLDKRLTPSVMLSHSGINREGFTADNRLRFNLRSDYKMTDAMIIRLAYTLSHYQYGSVRPGAQTTEHRFQLSVSQRF